MVNRIKDVVKFEIERKTKMQSFCCDRNEKLEIMALGYIFYWVNWNKERCQQMKMIQKFRQILMYEVFL